MTATADMILERRRQRRRLTFWRILAIVAITVAAISFLPRFGGAPGDHVARVSIDGVILGDPKRDKMIRDLAGSDGVKALIVKMNEREEPIERWK